MALDELVKRLADKIKSEPAKPEGLDEFEAFIEKRLEAKLETMLQAYLDPPTASGDVAPKPKEGDGSFAELMGNTESAAQRRKEIMAYIESQEGKA